MSDDGYKGGASRGSDWLLSFEEIAALKKIKSCAIAALISALMTMGWAVASLLVGEETKAGQYGYLLDPWMFLDAVLLLALAAMIYFKKSFPAALFLLVYFLLSKVIIAIETRSILGGVLALVFLYFYWRGVLGTRELRHLQDTFQPKRGAGANILRFIMGIALAAVLLLASWGALMSAKIVPDSTMIEGDDIPQRYAVKLAERGIMDEGERIEIFYSAGFMSILEDGNMMTDQRVISYEETEDEIFTESAAFGDISHVLISEDGSTFKDALLEVVRNDDSSFYLWMTVEDKAHLRFMDALRRKIAVAESNESIEPPELTEPDETTEPVEPDE